jgi:Uma2 family endonuclease
MSAVAHKLTVEEFRATYADRKPNYELLNGEAVQKALSTKRHSYLQVILSLLFDELGFHAGPELTLAISETWEPVPDVCGELGSDNEEPYPTQPVAVAIEILSPADPFTRVMQKCRRYAEWGIKDILVFDPVGLEAWFWDATTEDLTTIRQSYRFKSKPVELKLEEVFRPLNAKLKGGPQ